MRLRSSSSLLSPQQCEGETAGRKVRTAPQGPPGHHRGRVPGLRQGGQPQRLELLISSIHLRLTACVVERRYESSTVEISSIRPPTIRFAKAHKPSTRGQRIHNGRASADPNKTPAPMTTLHCHHSSTGWRDWDAIPTPIPNTNQRTRGGRRGRELSSSWI